MNSTFLPFIFVILFGIIYRNIVGKEKAEEVSKVLSTTVLHIFLPALCINTIYKTQLQIELFLVTVSAWFTIIACILVSITIYYLFNKIYPIKDNQKGVLILSSTFGNVTYIGIPVLNSLYGVEATKYALFYDLLATTPLLWLLGAPIAIHYGQNKKMKFIDSIKEILLLPPIWAMLIALLTNLLNIQIPSNLLKAFEILSGAVIPLMIFRVGLSISIPNIGYTYMAIPAIFIKLLLSPLIALIASKSLGLTGTALGACVIEGAMPTMVLSIIIAWRFNLDTSLSAFMIITTTIISIFTTPVFTYLGII